MIGVLKNSIATVVFLFLCAISTAQDKNLAYYAEHTEEILLDAKAAFQNSRYDRALELCKWHYVIVGDNKADALREKAKQCAELSEEMRALVLSNQQNVAKEKANAILALNPNDKAAREIRDLLTTTGSSNGHDWVDLGLSVKWAICNVGASSPEGYGDYFAWGETQPKSRYGWSTYKFWVSGDGEWDGVKFNIKINKYCTRSSYWEDPNPMDNKTVLAPDDDAAHVNWGGSWRMPTDEEWTELRTKCTWTWTTKNGVDGRKVTGPNGNSIFLPAAGYRYATGLYSAGADGYYWSSSLDTDDSHDAWNVYFGSGDVFRDDNGRRYYGFSVRPVTE